MRLTSLDRFLIGLVLVLPTFIVNLGVLTHYQVPYSAYRLFGLVVSSAVAPQIVMFTPPGLVLAWRWTRRLGRARLR